MPAGEVALLKAFAVKVGLKSCPSMQQMSHMPPRTMLASEWLALKIPADILAGMLACCTIFVEFI